MRNSMSRLILASCLLLIILIQCSKNYTEVSFKQYKTPIYLDINQRFTLIHKDSKTKVGYAQFRVKNYFTDNKIYYITDQHLNIQWTQPDNNDKMNLNIHHKSVIDNHFKLLHFSGKLVENKETSHRSGFYRYPYFYITEGSKKSMIKASKGIFSKLIEHYLLRYYMTRPGKEISYHFLNLVSLNVEEERLYYEKQGFLYVQNTKVPIRYLISYNYANHYYNRSWFTMDHRLLQRTDFKESIIWRLDNPFKSNK